MKRKSPSFQLYPKQFLGDDKVMLMDWDAQGMHFHLMCISWQQDQPGTLPNEEIIIRRWCKNPSAKTWKRVWPQIKKSWQVSTKNPFKLFSRALVREHKKQRAFSRLQTEKAKNSWISRRKHTDATALPRHDSGNARASNALLSSSSPPGFNIPHTPQGGAHASHANGNGRRYNGTNLRAQGLNPRAIASKAIQETAKAKQYRDPIIPETEEMTEDEMKAIRQEKFGVLRSEVISPIEGEQSEQLKRAETPIEEGP